MFCRYHLLHALGGLTNPPDVDTRVDYQMNELTVRWSMVGIENIVNFVVIVENSQTRKQTAVVGPAQTETSFFIEPDATMFNVTVIAYDTCQKNSSTTVSVIVQRDRIKSKTLTETSTSLLAHICTSTDVIRLSQSVVPPPTCVGVENLENNQGYTNCYNLLYNIVVFIICRVLHCTRCYYSYYSISISYTRNYHYSLLVEA